MNANIKIAVVDDNSLIRGTVTLILKDAGFTVYSFGCPTELLGSEALQTVDCVLTDLEMPTMKGTELQLRVLGKRPKLPVVFMTASSDDGFRRCAMRRGAFAYLSKPMRIPQLVSILAEATASFRTSRGLFPSGLAVAAQAV
jgi:putative two-component system response regulator